MLKRLRLKYIILECIAVLFSIGLFISCSTSNRLVYGNYYSQGDYIIECNNTDGWRYGHYLITIDSSNIFVLKEVSVGLGMRYTICSGYLQSQGPNIYALKKIKEDYPYGVLGNPIYNEDNYRITVKKNGAIVLQRKKWKTIMQFIPSDSIPKEFDFTKYGYSY